MKPNKPRQSKSTGHWRGTSSRTLNKSGNNFAPLFGPHFRFQPRPQFNSDLFTCLQMFRPAHAGLLGLAQLEAQLILNNLGNIAFGDPSRLWNPVLLNLLHTILSQNTAPVSLFSPPRVASCLLPQAPLSSSTSRILPSVSSNQAESSTANCESTMMNTNLLNEFPQKHIQDSHSVNTSKTLAKLLEETLASTLNYQNKKDIPLQTFPRTRSLNAPSTYTSGGVFKNSHSKNNSERRELPRCQAQSRTNNDFLACQHNDQGEWHDQDSPSQSISPSPSWSPSPPPLSHYSVQRSFSSDRYSPADLTYEYSEKRTFSDRSQKVNYQERKDSSSSVGESSHTRYPFFKLPKREDYYSLSTHNFSTDSVSNANRVKQSSTQNVLQRKHNTNKKEAWNPTLSQSTVRCLNAVCHLYASGIPAHAMYQEVCRCLAPLGVIKELVFYPDRENQVLASIHLLEEVNAGRISKYQNITICKTSINVTSQEPVTNNYCPKQKVSQQQPVTFNESYKGKVKNETVHPWIHGSMEGVLVLISGFPEKMESEDDFIKLAAPHGVPSRVVIAAAQRKILLELPDKESAKKMVVAYNAIPIGLKQVDMKLLPDTVDINNPMSLFQIIMGPDHPGGTATDLHQLLTVGNVPETVGEISQVQQIIHSLGAVNRTLILNNNMVLFEMMTPKEAKFTYDRLKNSPYILHNLTLTFFWGTNLPVTTKKNVEELTFDVDISDFVRIDDIGDATEFRQKPITLPTKLGKSMQATKKLELSRTQPSNASGFESMEAAKLIPFSEGKGNQSNQCQKQRNDGQKNKQWGIHRKKRQDGILDNNLPSIKSINPQTEINLKIADPLFTKGLKDKKSLLQKAQSFIRKRNSSAPTFHDGYCLLPFNPKCPIGTEFIEQKPSFFCKVCRKFTVGDEGMIKLHCCSLRHFKNLERCLQSWQQKRYSSGQSQCDENGRHFCFSSSTC